MSRCGLFDAYEVGAYMSRHLSAAGAGHELFTEAAMDEIYRFSSGATWLVNKLCTHALIYGAQNKHRIVDDYMVKRVSRENCYDSPCFSTLLR
jgi:general secretion pathway protein A